MRIVALVTAWLLAAGGSALFVLYILVVIGRVGDVEHKSDAAALGGFGLSLAAAGFVCLAGLARRHRHDLIERIRFPNTWTSLLVFAAAVGAGAYGARSARWPVFDVLLATLAVVAILTFYGRIALHWGPRRAVDGRDALGPGAWGMAGAPFIAIVMQGVAFLAIAGAVLGGLYLADPDIMHAAREQGVSNMVDSESDFVGHATIAVALTGTYALIAPLTEEIAKFLGVVVLLRGRVLTRYSVFAAGVSVGLGFAVVETLGYGLSAGDLWPLVIGFRAPVTLIHITGTSLCALGWYEQRKRGGLRLLWFYLIAVAVHGSWNGLTVAALVAGSTFDETTDMTVGTVLLLLNVLLLMAVILACCALWIALNARRFGKEAARFDASAMPAHMNQEFVLDRGPVLKGVAAGEA